MLKYLTLREKIDYSWPALHRYMINNFWALVCWAFGTYLLPVHSVIFIMVFMVIVDFFTGIYRAFKDNEAITSKKLGATIEKMVLYMIGIIVSFVLQNHIGIDVFKIMWVFGTLIITREYISIIENIEGITGTRLVFAIRKYLDKFLPTQADEAKNKQDEDSRSNKEIKS
jgi:phage-related holin